MPDKSFGVKELNLIEGAGVPTIESPNNLNLNANQVSISADWSAGGQCMSDLVMGPDYSISGSSITADELITSATVKATALPAISVNGQSGDPGAQGQLFTMAITAIFNSTDSINDLGALSSTLKIVCSSSAV